MVSQIHQAEHVSEHVVARLTEAAYQVVLRRERLANFVDVQLALWAALSATLEYESQLPVTEVELPASLSRTVIEVREGSDSDLELKGI